MEEEVKNEEVKNVKKSCNSGVGTFFFLVVVVSIIVASIICGILEYNYYMEARIGNLQRQIDELKEINTQMESNYNDALNSNVELEETAEDTTVETTEDTTVENTAAENTVAENTVVENAVTNNTTAENVVNTIE
jgi:predicted PurR-regulated permease PerM